MDLRKLEIFVAAAERESISLAAEALHMAQPAVSIAIARLEQELEVALFERSGRRVRLTAEGRRLQEEARALLEHAAALEDSVGRLRRLESGELHLGCPAMLATYFLPRLLGDFLVEYPGLQASVTQAGTADVERMLLEDQLETGVITVQADSADAGLELRRLLRQRVVVLVGKDHPWAGRRHLNLAALAGQPMVLYEHGYFIRERFDALCREHQVAPEVRVQTNFLPLLIDMVQRGVGIGIGLDMMAAAEPGLTGIPLRPGIELELALAKRRGRRIARANQAFMDWLAAS